MKPFASSSMVLSGISAVSRVAGRVGLSLHAEVPSKHASLIARILSRADLPSVLRGWFLLMCACTMIEAARAASESYALRQWRIADGLPSESTNALARSADGTIWIATLSGLAAFDGQRFRVFDEHSQPTMPNERAVSVYAEPNGPVWVLTERNEVLAFDGARFEDRSPAGVAGRAKLMAMDRDEKGDHWIIDRDGTLIRLRDGSVLEGPDSRPSVRGPTQFARDPTTGELYFLHLGTVGRIVGDRWEPVRSATDSWAEAVGPAKEGGIWVQYPGQVRRWVGAGWTSDRVRLPASCSPSTALAETAEGTLVVATAHQGVFLINRSGDYRNFSRENGLVDNWVKALSIGGDGTIWLGISVTGISALYPTHFESLATPSEWDPRPCKAVTSSRDGGVWVATEGNGLAKYDGAKWLRWGPESGLTNSFLWTVAEDRTGRVWVGSWGGGLFEFAGGRFVRVSGLEDENESIAALFVARDNSLWIGTTHGLWCRRPDGSTARFGTRAESSRMDVRAIAEGSNGVMWYGLANGRVGRVVQNELDLPGGVELTLSAPISCLFVDEEAELWIGTLGDGLHHWDGKRQTSYHDQVILGRAISWIGEREGRLWIASEKGVSGFGRQQLRAVIHDSNLRLRPEFSIGNATLGVVRAAGAQPAGCISPDGAVWLPTLRGVLKLRPDVDEHLDVPRPLLERVSVDGRMVPLPWLEQRHPRLVVPAGSSRVAIDCWIPFFRGHERLEVTYRLNQDAWLEAGDRRSFDFHKLPPGDYQFQVAVAHEGGRSETALDFVVEPRFWQIGWVRALGFAGALGAAAALARWQAQAVNRRRTDRLRREREIERERTRIARDIHDDLGASLTRINLLSQTARDELADPRTVDQRLEQINRTARTLTAKMDEIVWAVSPRHDSLDSVVHYLCSFAEEHLGGAGIRCRFDIPRVIKPEPVYAEARHNVFLAFQEAIHNIIKHARASVVTVTITVADDRFEISLVDDGIGLRAEDPRIEERKGNGLANMTRRLADIGGAFEYRKTPTGGTQVHFSIPLSRRNPTLPIHP